ncbi:MAG TPA: glycosyltransferase, partial [Kiritimatiellia bacterium]|nr:glycosyltransferase [Kiritimatiellia bacterium]
PDHPINLIALNAEQIPYAIAEFDPSYFQSRYNIAVWNWELPHLPETWLDSTRYLNEIWAPSAFCHEAFSQRLHLPVVRMPYAIDIHPDPAITRHTLNLPPDPFLFLFMFDVLSVPERKNPLGLIHAFLEAAPAFNRPATLVLKMINADKDTPTLRAVRQAAATHPNILLIDRYLTRPQLNGLFNVVDAYASLHRSEGFGLTLAESMALAKPVLGTAWSSTLDFMTPRNSYLVDYTLTELDRDYGPYKKGQVWAEPDLHHAATLLADIVNHPQEAAARARRAQADIQTNYSPTVIGQRIRSRLTHILQTT